MNSQLTYRLYQPADISGLLRLWETNTEWGALTAQQWRQWYVDTPHGPCTVSVGLDEASEIRAQGVFTPTILSFHDRELKACRTSAPILDKQLRAATRIHPIARLYQTIKEEAIREDFSLIYAFPNLSLRSFLRRYLPTLKLETMGCVSSPVQAWLGNQIPGTTVNPAEFGEEYLDLWVESKQDFPLAMAVVRSPAWLRYKYNGKLALAVRRETGTLLGYSVFDRNTGLLVDCLARTRDDLTVVLRASMQWLARNCGAFDEIKAMYTPFMAPILDSLEFTAHDYQFLLGRDVLNPNLSLDSFDLCQWHVMPGD